MAKNRLKLHRAYLVGPMDHNREGGRGWREDMTAWLKARRIITLNPYDKPVADINKNGLEDDDNHERVKEALAAKDLKLARQLMKPVRSIDLRLVDHADFLIVNLDKERYPFGTIEEMVTANREKKPVLVYMPQGLENSYPWSLAMLPPEFFFESWKDLKDYIDHIDSAPDEQIDTLNRWVFFELEHQIREILNEKEPYQRRTFGDYSSND